MRLSLLYLVFSIVMNIVSSINNDNFYIYVLFVDCYHLRRRGLMSCRFIYLTYEKYYEPFYVFHTIYYFCE